VDQTLVIVLIVVLLPVALLWVLAKSAALRGPAPPAAEKRRPIESLVTEAIPEEHPDEEWVDAEDSGEHEPERSPYSGPPF
jgi:hypothetical protein